MDCESLQCKEHLVKKVRMDKTTANSSVCWLPPQRGLNGQRCLLAVSDTGCGTSMCSTFPIAKIPLAPFGKINQPGCYVSRIPESLMGA